MKWPSLAAKSRRSVAEALTTITLALTGPRPGPPGPEILRRALLCYAFNHADATRPVPAEITCALDWAAKASPPVAAPDDPDTVRAVLSPCARRLDGRPAAAATTRRPSSGRRRCWWLRRKSTLERRGAGNVARRAAARMRHSRYVSDCA
jgi:hypothetical protein